MTAIGVSHMSVECGAVEWSGVECAYVRHATHTSQEMGTYMSVECGGVRMRTHTGARVCTSGPAL
jgi:hypothetical protein